MYEYLEGEVVRHTPMSLVLAVGGVGYHLSTPVGSCFPQGEVRRAWTHLVVREDAHTLFGFATVEQRDLFRLLLSVRGVGPAMALAMLSGLEADALVDAIVREDTASLTRIKGIGKRTAEQILLDLREKVGRLGSRAQDGVAAPTEANARDEQLADAVSALISIGYKEKEATKLIAKTAEGAENLALEDLIRTALRG